uniref:DUF7694 domain-containing protein n=1 Tax=viral metagenome TaxID=1070528 RepID=A0A6H1ZTI7_9ZZZZ
MKKEFIKKDSIGTWWEFDSCIVCISKDLGKWHLSISHLSRYPTYDEIKSARYEFIEDSVTMAMFFPPKAEFVNLSKNCFHLYEL